MSKNEQALNSRRNPLTLLEPEEVLAEDEIALLRQAAQRGLLQLGNDMMVSGE